MTDPELVAFLQWALPRLGLRWEGFRRVRSQVRKRLQRRLDTLGLQHLGQYRGHLETHPAEWAVLDAACRITISRFWRDRQVFQTLGLRVLPVLVRTAAPGPLRAWSAGCASGEEPYGLSILWELELRGVLGDMDLEITATDADPTMLRRASRGGYPPGNLKELPPEWRAAAFSPPTEPGGERFLEARFRRPVRLLLQDLRRDSPPGPFHLVLCRNLAFTYFDAPLQRRVQDRIHGLLVPGGALVVGAHEVPPPHPSLSPWPGAPHVYRAG